MGAGYLIDCERCGTRHDVDAQCPIPSCPSCVQLHEEVEESHRIVQIRDKEIETLREEGRVYRERWKLEQIRYEGISSANEELREKLKRRANGVSNW